MWHFNMFFAASDTPQLCLYKPKWLCLWTESSAHIRHLIIAMRLGRLIKNRYCTARLGTLWHGTALMQSKLANYGSLHKSTAQEPRAIDETLDECVLLKCGVSVSLPPSLPPKTCYTEVQSRPDPAWFSPAARLPRVGGMWNRGGGGQWS